LLDCQIARLEDCCIINMLLDRQNVDFLLLDCQRVELLNR